MSAEGEGEDTTPAAEPEEEKAPVEEAPAPKPPPLTFDQRTELLAKRAGTWASLLDFSSVPRSKAGWILRAVITVVVFAFLWRRVVGVTHTLIATKPSPTIPTEEIEDYRFRLPEHTRRDIFRDLATVEVAERARAIAANTWGGHLWSREDDRGHYERVAARGAAQKYHCSLSQVYLVLDEGIRERWPGPDGNPLPATTPPHSIRTTSW